MKIPTILVLFLVLNLAEGVIAFGEGFRGRKSTDCRYLGTVGSVTCGENKIVPSQFSK